MGETMAAALIRTGSITTTLDGSNKGVLETKRKCVFVDCPVKRQELGTRRLGRLSNGFNQATFRDGRNKQLNPKCERKPTHCGQLKVNSAGLRRRSLRVSAPSDCFEF